MGYTEYSFYGSTNINTNIRGWVDGTLACGNCRSELSEAKLYQLEFRNDIIIIFVATRCLRLDKSFREFEKMILLYQCGLNIDVKKNPFPDVTHILQSSWEGRSSR